MKSFLVVLCLRALVVSIGVCCLAGVARAQGYAWKQVNLQGMGHVTGLLMHPGVEGLIYARTDVAGAFRWDQQEGQWVGLMDRFSWENKPLFSVESIAIDPSNPDRIYAACGTFIYHFYNNTGEAKGWMLRSDNRGQDWSVVQVPIYMGGNEEWRYTGERLFVDPNNTQVLYFGSRRDGLWRSTNRGASWSKVSSFTKVGGWQGAAHQGGVSVVLVDGGGGTVNVSGVGTVSRVIYVGLINDGSDNAGLWRSTDGGQSWAAIPVQEFNQRWHSPMRLALASDRTLYVTYSSGFNKENEWGPGEVYKWNPVASAWTKITPPMSLMVNNRNFIGVAVNPQNPQHVFVTTDNHTPRDIFRSLDGGQTWNLLQDGAFPSGNFSNPAVFPVQITVPAWWPKTYGTLTHCYSWAAGLVLDPHQPDTLWLSNGYGIYRGQGMLSPSGPFTLETVMKGQEMLNVQQVVSPAAPSPRPVVFTALDMFGFALADLDQPPPAYVAPGVQAQGTGVAIHPTNPNVMVMVGSRLDGTTPISRLTTNGGVSWSNLNTFSGAVGGNVAIATSGRLVWFPMVKTQDFGTSSPKGRYSDNNGSSWSEVQGTFPQNNICLSQIWLQASVLESDKAQNHMYLYAFDSYSQEKARFYRSTDGGRTWSLVNSTQLPAWNNAFVRAVPGRAGEVWVGFNNSTPATWPSGIDKLYRSTNGGTAFAQITSVEACYGFGFGAPLETGGLPAVYLYGKVGGVLSLWRSEDLGVSWTDLLGGAPVPLGVAKSVVGCSQEPGRVYVGTDRGLWYGVPVSASQTPLAQWLQTHFGTSTPSGEAALDQDPDQDGLNNLLEYALVGDPHSDSPEARPLVLRDGALLEIHFRRDPTRTDLTLEVEGSSDLTTWATLARSPSGQAFVPVAAGVQVEETSASGLWQVRVRDGVSLAGGPRFLRLRADVVMP